jgi:predicted nuclease with TOPRIM domain
MTWYFRSSRQTCNDCQFYSDQCNSLRDEVESLEIEIPALKAQIQRLEAENAKMRELLFFATCNDLYSHKDYWDWVKKEQSKWMNDD